MRETDRGPGCLAPPLDARHGAELARFLESMPAAFCFLGPDWRFRYVNAEAERLMNRPRDEMVGESLWEAFPGLSGSIVESTYRESVATGRPMVFETAHRNAPERWVEARVWPGPDGLAVYVLDVTDRRDAEESARRAAARAALLGRVSAELAAELNPRSALGLLAQLVVPVLTDGCIVTVVDRDGRARDVGSWHVDPTRRGLMEEYSHVRLDTLPSASPVAQALQDGTPVTESVDTVLALMAPGPARDLLTALHPATAVVLPLRAEGRTFGVLTLYLDAGRTLSGEDLDTARQVAAGAGGAVARVHRQSQQAQLAEALQRSLLTEPPAMDDVQIVVRYVPAARPRASVATGSTPSPSGTGPRSWSSATSSGTTRPPPRRWDSSGPSCAGSPTSAGPVRPRCCAGWTRPSPTCTPARSRRQRSPGSRARGPAVGPAASAGPTPATRPRSCWGRTGPPPSSVARSAI